MDDARARWRVEHRRRRIRRRRYGPLVRALSVLLLVAAAGFAVAAVLADLMWFGAGLGCLVAALLLRGVTLSEIFSSGSDVYVTPGGDGGCDG